MPIPFDLQKFSGEIVTGLAVFVADRAVPAARRWLKRRSSGNPEATDLRITAPRASLRFLNQSGTDAELTVHLEIMSLSGKLRQLEQFQINWLHFDGHSLPHVDGKVIPPYVSVPKRGVAEPHISIRLHPADIQIILGAAIRSQNVYSTPGHHLRIGLLFVSKGRLHTSSVGPKEVTVPVVEASFPTALMPPV